MESARAGELRRGAAIRLALAVAIAAAISTIAVLITWGPLTIKSDVVGYPTFSDFSYQNYFRLYFFCVFFFPTLAWLIFLGLDRAGPRIGLPVPASRGRLRPTGEPPASSSPLTADPPARELAGDGAVATSVGRVFGTGVVVGLAVGIAIDSVWLGLVIGVVAYGALAALAAVILRGSGEPRLRPLARVNAVGAALTVAALYPASAITAVKVVDSGKVHHYPWAPLWLVLPLAIIAVALVVRALRRAEAHRAAEIERRALLLIAAPVGFVLLLQTLPGDLGFYDMFHNGEQLGGARLVESGFFPWRDVVLTHGLLQDVIVTFGQGVFGSTSWGFAAGTSMIMGPLYLIAQYYLFVYLFGRNWWLLLATILLTIGTVLVQQQFRLILWPLILLLLATVLDRRANALRIGLLALLSVGQAILTPEAAPALIAVGLVLIAYEWYWRQPGTGVASAYRRTAWFVIGCVAVASAFAGYLVANHALDDWVFISIKLLHGHAQSGAVPPGPNAVTISQLEFDIMALTPPLALVISFAYAAAMLRLRRTFTTADWVMGAAALFIVPYYLKFVSRMDTGHVYEPFVAALPLILYIVYRLVMAGEQYMRRRWPDTGALRLTLHPISLVLVVALVVVGWTRLHTDVDNAAARYRPVVQAEPKLPRLGYDTTIDMADYNDQKRVVEAYLGSKGRMFDFTNEPALFFYLMNRFPSTRYFHISLAYSADLQKDLINELRASRPKLIALDDQDSAIAGLATWDGIPTNVRTYLVAQWILDHYRPLLTTHSHTYYLRRGVTPIPSAQLHLSQPPIVKGVPFETQQCLWNFAPNFLSGPGEPPSGKRSVRVAAGPVKNPTSTVFGWAGDQKAQLPAREVIATANGRVVARAVPHLDRPDLPAGGWPAGFETAGYHLQVPAATIRKPGLLHIFGVARDGAVASLPTPTSPALTGTVQIASHSVKLQPKAVAGSFDGALSPASMQIRRPAGSSWSDYRWLEIYPGSTGWRQGQFAIFDRQARPSPLREISFQSLDRSPTPYVVPVGSCAQWHAYQSSRLFLSVPHHLGISAVRLVR